MKACLSYLPGWHAIPNRLHACRLQGMHACVQNKRLLCCMPRGQVFGQLLVQEGAGGPILDCSARVQTIPGDVAAIGTYLFQSQAKYLRLITRCLLLLIIQRECL